MKIYKSITLLALMLVCFSITNVKAMQNPNEKNLIESQKNNENKEVKEIKGSQKAITIDKTGNIIIDVKSVQSPITIGLIEQKINQEQANLLETESNKIKITPKFPQDCNTFFLLWSTEKLANTQPVLLDSNKTDTITIPNQNTKNLEEK